MFEFEPWARALGLPRQCSGKESAWSAGDLGSIPELERSPVEGNGNPLSILAWRIPWTEEAVGYSPWGCKELNVTEHSSACIIMFVKVIYLDHKNLTL